MNLADQNTVFRMALAMVRGMGVDLAQKLLEVLGDEQEFFALSERQMQAITGSRNKICDKAYRNQCLEKARREADFVEQGGIAMHYFTDDTFPKRLLQAPDAPILLYQVGSTPLNPTHAVSIVGTRHITPHGERFTHQLVSDLAQAIPDLVTVSGLAYGSDITAHRASVQNNVPTIAVQACGLNKIYPASHRNDAAAIVRSGGSIVSDYSSQDALHKGNFVARNRIIAALSDCTVVVESALHGGSLITANIAQSYNRDVFAVPGRSSDEFSSGCNNLIMRNQAMLIGSADDLIQAMRWESRKRNAQAVQAEIFPQLNAREQQLVDIIKDNDQININDLAAKAALPIYKVMATLVDLDTRHIIITHPGCRYSMA